MHGESNMSGAVGGGGGDPRRTFVRFAATSPVLASGDIQGRVSLVRMHGTEVQPMSPQEQVERLLHGIAMNENKK